MSIHRIFRYEILSKSDTSWIACTAQIKSTQVCIINYIHHHHIYFRHLFVNGIDDFDEQFAIELAKASPYLCRVDANGSRFDVAVAFPADVPTIAIARLDD
jgi:hypothetical protein